MRNNNWIILIPDAPKNVWPYLHSHLSMPVFKPTLNEAKRFTKKREAVAVINQFHLDYCKLQKQKI